MEQNSKKDGLFYDFWGRNHCSFAHISSKIVHSLKNTWLSRQYFIKKISILSKHGTLMSFFFSWIIPFYHSGDWSKKRKFCQNYTLYKKSPCAYKWPQIENFMEFSNSLEGQSWTDSLMFLKDMIIHDRQSQNPKVTKQP